MKGRTQELVGTRDVARLGWAIAAAGVLVLAGCGGGDGDSGGGASGIQCGPTEDALVTLDEGISVILKLEFPHEYERVKNGELDFDSEAFLAAIETLRPLEKWDLADMEEAFGTTADALDLYEKGGRVAAASLAADDPFTSGEIDELKAAIGSTAEFVTPQHGVRLAADRAGCDPPDE